MTILCHKALTKKYNANSGGMVNGYTLNPEILFHKRKYQKENSIHTYTEKSITTPKYMR